MESCPVVLGSATPSLESWHNARSGRFNLLELPDRVGGGRLPRVEIVDIGKEWGDLRRGSARERSMGNRLRHALAQTLEHGGQAIMLLNKRGFSTLVCCADSSCGWKLECDQCSVLMVQHKSTHAGVDGFVRCHHCLAQQLVKKLCPVCGQKTVRRGFGTQRVEDELRDQFPELAEEGRLVRVDSDSMQRAGDYFRVLDSFRSGEARVMLGTQMIAKGLDFPGVELIGVINADTALSMPDFRASERTYQLVSQVAGRAGRSEESGAVARVIVQTMQPQERAIRCAAKHDFVSFADRELATRDAALLPPVWRMARVVCRDADAHRAEARAQEVCDALHGAAHDALARNDARIYGPMECPIARIAGQFRMAVEVYGRHATLVQEILAKTRSMGVVKSDAKTAVDVDPVALL
jgi:primosomal protein N' (replication factor Y)